MIGTDRDLATMRSITNYSGCRYPWYGPQHPQTRCLMTSFTFTPEQVRSAPVAVRDWMMHEIAQALNLAQRAAHDPSQAERTPLSACSVDEALQILDRIRGNFLLMQVFFELARDATPGRTAPPLHVLDVGEMLHHTRLNSGEGLVRTLEAINAAYGEVHRDPQATLFGFDDHGHVYIHQETHLSVRHLWEQLERPAPPPTPSEMAPFGFAAPQLGPDQGVASHAPERPKDGR